MGTRPTFPPPLYPETRALSLAFSDDAQLNAWRTVKRFPRNNTFAYDVVVRLHRLSLATSSEWHERLDPRVLSNLYFEAMHEALFVTKEEPWTAALPKGLKGVELTTMFRAWAASLPLFVWATTRHLRVRFCIDTPWFGHEIIISRIQKLLDDPGIWPRGKTLEPVLVALFYCIEACDLDSTSRPWILQTIRKLTGTLKLAGPDEFKKILGSFPTTEDYRLMADEVWAEITYATSYERVSLDAFDSNPSMQWNMEGT